MQRGLAWMMLLLLPAALGGCGSSSEPDATGSCDDDPTCCPADYPVDGTDCNKTTACAYSVGASCPAGGVQVEASCQSGVWAAPVSAACSLQASASCDPLGTWLVTVEPVAGTLPPEPFEFGAEKQKDQVLVSGAESATLSPDGCDLTLEWYANHRVPSVGGFSNTTTQLKLTISGDVASGQYTVSCVGECAGGSSAPASAKRMAPAG